MNIITITSKADVSINQTDIEIQMGSPGRGDSLLPRGLMRCICYCNKCAKVVLVSSLTGSQWHLSAPDRYKQACQFIALNWLYCWGLPQSSWPLNVSMSRSLSQAFPFSLSGRVPIYEYHLQLNSQMCICSPVVNLPCSFSFSHTSMGTSCSFNV